MRDTIVHEIHLKDAVASYLLDEVEVDRHLNASFASWQEAEKRRLAPPPIPIPHKQNGQDFSQPSELSQPRLALSACGALAALMAGGALVDGGLAAVVVAEADRAATVALG
ncbi:MAG: hypothetical protein EOP06_20095, partial [Proteobacteria bacterium]